MAIVASNPTRQGYQFNYNVAAVAPPNVRSLYYIVAYPATWGTTGIRNFYIDEQGVVFGAQGTAQGAPAIAAHATAANRGDPDGVAVLIWQPIQ